MNKISAPPKAPTLADGVYFGLPEDTYHSLPRLSASGIKNLLVSPMDFWARSWLNPNVRSEDDEPEWAIKGTAYHKRICEGKEAFYACYAAELDPADHPDALFKQAHLKAACQELELKVGGTNAELIERLLAAGCKYRIWDVMVDEHRQENAGKTLLPAAWIYDIELAAACIEKHPTLCKSFKGGYPEVSVLWTAEVQKNDGSGEVFDVPMKARFDYLKPAAIVDLKSFANRMQKPMDRAVYFEIAAHRYHVQAAIYYQAAEALRGLLADKLVNVESGSAPSQAWLDAVAKNPKLFMFVFQQKGVAPVASGYTVPREMGLMSVAEAQIREAQQVFHDCLKHFGDLPWIMDRDLNQIGDNDIPPFATE